MSGAVNYVMARIAGAGSFSIPPQILQEVFKDEWMDREMPTSLNDKIYNRLIRPRVLQDINMFYGEQILIDLNRAEYLNIGDFARIYRFSPSHTGNREIISADCVGFVPYGMNSNYQAASSLTNMPIMSNELMNYGSQVMSSVSSMPSVITTRCDIVGFNTVRVTDRQRFQSSYSLRAYVTNDNNLANIPAQAFPKLHKLCILALKAYIYNEYIVTMGDNFLRRGQELGVFKSIIERWENMEEEYLKFLEEEWAVQPYFSNDDQHHGFLQMLIPIGI